MGGVLDNQQLLQQCGGAPDRAPLADSSAAECERCHWSAVGHMQRTAAELLNTQLNTTACHQATPPPAGGTRAAHAPALVLRCCCRLQAQQLDVTRRLGSHCCLILGQLLHMWAGGTWQQQQQYQGRCNAARTRWHKD